VVLVVVVVVLVVVAGNNRTNIQRTARKRCLLMSKKTLMWGLRYTVGMQVRFDKTISGLALAFVILLLPASALAHAPRFVREQKVIEVTNPDISQAFYGWLDGQAVLYKIKTDVPQQLYIQLLVPDVKGVKTDLKAELKAHEGEGMKSFMLEDKTAWPRWYEDFGGEWYLKGPELRQDVGTGTQSVFVSNADLYGPYVFVVGEKESFTPDEMLATLKMLPELHQEFFLRPWYSSFFNRVGLFMAIPFAVLAIIVFAMAMLYRHSQRLLRRVILACFGIALLALTILAVWDLVNGSIFGMATDFAALFACLAGYVGIVWIWRKDKTGIQEIQVNPPSGK